jgi:hypothetical protein
VPPAVADASASDEVMDQGLRDLEAKIQQGLYPRDLLEKMLCAAVKQPVQTKGSHRLRALLVRYLPGFDETSCNK